MLICRHMELLCWPLPSSVGRHQQDFVLCPGEGEVVRCHLPPQLHLSQLSTGARQQVGAQRVGDVPLLLRGSLGEEGGGSEGEMMGETPRRVPGGCCHTCQPSLRTRCPSLPSFPSW